MTYGTGPSLDAVSPRGTPRYDGLTDLPPLVERAVDLARREGFANSCRPEHGRLLHALAAGAGRIGETGTGCGVGLAWLASGARPGTRLVSVELDAGRAALAAELFAGQPQVTVIQGDWTKIARRPRTTCWCWTAGDRARAADPAGRPGSPAPAGRHPGHRRPDPGLDLAAALRGAARPGPDALATPIPP